MLIPKPLWTSTLHDTMHQEANYFFKQKLQATRKGKVDQERQ